MAIRAGGGTGLVSRNRNDVTASYPEIAAAVDASVSVDDVVLDGEVVAFDSDRTSFSRLQQRIHLTPFSWSGSVRATGRAGSRPSAFRFSTTSSTCFAGTAKTRPAYPSASARPSCTTPWTGATRCAGASTSRPPASRCTRRCAAGEEGIIAKRASSRYTSGRSADWLKMKCVREQEVVVGGFTEPIESRTGLGALLIGCYDDGRLPYGGKVGTGFTRTVLGGLRVRLDRLETPSPPFVDPPRERTAHWVAPELVVQVAFAEWTLAGRLRHPAYKGIRTDEVRPTSSAKAERQPVRRAAPMCQKLTFQARVEVIF